MLFIKYTKHSEQRALVTMEHHEPHTLPEEVLAQGELINSPIPNMDEVKLQQGLIPYLYFNPTTKELFYEYAPRPKDPADVTELKTLVEEQAMEIAMLWFELMKVGV